MGKKDAKLTAMHVQLNETAAEIVNTAKKKMAIDDGAELDKLMADSQHLVEQSKIFSKKIEPEVNSIDDRIEIMTKKAAYYLSVAFDYTVAAIGWMFSQIGQLLKLAGGNMTTSANAALKEDHNELAKMQEKSHDMNKGKGLGSGGISANAESFLDRAKMMKAKDKAKVQLE